jgi:hypothetical protein
MGGSDNPWDDPTDDDEDDDDDGEEDAVGIDDIGIGV